MTTQIKEKALLSICQVLNIEINEKFNIITYTGELLKNNPHRLLDCGVVDNKGTVVHQYLNHLLTGKMIIISTTNFKPKFKESYWTFNPTDKSQKPYLMIWTGCKEDWLNYHCGLIFKTEAEVKIKMNSKNPESKNFMDYNFNIIRESYYRNK